MSDEDHIMDDQDVHEDTDDPRATGKKPEIDYEKDPIEVKKRVLALKKLQLETTLIEAKFFKEMHELEQKYLPLFQPFWEKRNLITTGKYEPKDDECYGLEELAEEMKAISLEKDKEKKESGETKGDDGNKNDEPTESKSGIPDFWVKIFGNVDIIAELLEENDIPVLQCLNDIKIEMLNDPMGFKLHFHFDENAWFTNKVLTKTYFMKCDPDPADPFAFEGTEIVKCIGCPIDWNKGKNLTVKVIKKKQKHKQRGSIRTIQKTVPIPSFFNFFSPPIVPEEGSPDSMDEETQMRLTNDFEIGQYIRERVVPRAVLFYTGEALDNEEEEDFEEEEDDDDDDDDDEEDSDADGNEEDESHVNPKNVRRSGGGGGAGGAGPDGAPNSKARAAQNRRMQKLEKGQQECQQQ